MDVKTNSKMVRNRLAELQEKSGVKAPESTEEEEMKPLKKQDKKMSTSQEDFLNSLQSITSDIDTVQKNVSRIETLQTRILHAVSQKDVEKEKDELNDLNDNTKRVANKIRESLKTQQDNNEKNKKKEISELTSREQTDQRLRITQVASQTKRFSEVWSTYNESQLEFRKKSKATLIKAAKITGITNLTDDKIEEMIDEGHTDGLFGGNLHATVQAEKDKLLALQSRHGEFMKLEKQIEEVAQLFKEIAVLVESQGEMVDNIYQNVLNAEVLVEKGTDNLEKAEKSQKSARKKKAICFSILFVVILIVFLVILAEFGAFSYSSSSNTYTTTTTTTTLSPTTVTNNDGVEWDPNFVPDSKT